MGIVWGELPFPDCGKKKKYPPPVFLKPLHVPEAATAQAGRY